MPPILKKIHDNAESFPRR